MAWAKTYHTINEGGLTMPRVTPAEFQEKHARRLKGAIEDIRKGVEKVSASPTAAAAAKQDKMLARLQAKVQDGTWAARLKAVTLESWKADTLEKGIPRVAGGVDRAAEKVTAFAGKLLPYQASLQSQVEKMPDVTLEDSIGRMTAWIRGMAKFKP